MTARGPRKPPSPMRCVDVARLAKADARVEDPIPTWLLETVRNEPLRFQFLPTQAGVHGLVASCRELPAPIAVLWFRFFGRDPGYLDVQALHVEERLRRCGVARRTIEYLQRAYPHWTVVTGSLSRDGLALWKALGGESFADGPLFRFPPLADQANAAKGVPA